MIRSTQRYFFPLLISLLFWAETTFAQGRNQPGESVPAILPDGRAMAAKRVLLDQIDPINRDKRPPNVVLLFSDDLGYADTGSYGSKTIPTPHIDALAKNGIKFTEAYVTAGTCSPSRAGLISRSLPATIWI